MSTILAKDVVARSAITLNDPTFGRWTQSELLKWLNAGQRFIAKKRPEESTKKDSVQLATGTLQTVPADCEVLFDIPWNMGTNGTTVGRIIRETELSHLDAVLPNWRTSTASATVKHFIRIPNKPRDYYVYPPQPSSNRGYVEILYGIKPVDATINGVDSQVADSVISLDDRFGEALYHYILHRVHAAFREEAHAAASVAQFNLFLAAAGIVGKAA